MDSERIALTFGDAGENHIGMEMVGELGQIGSGFTTHELEEAEQRLRDYGLEATYFSFDLEHDDTCERAGILIIRNFLSPELHAKLYGEMNTFEWDTKYWDTRRKKVLNKRARSNVVILDGIEQEPDYEGKKGRIVDGDTLPGFAEVKRSIQDCVGYGTHTEKAENLICEGNRYYDLKKCGIGYHGDAERRKVIALSLGASATMNWQWFHRSKPVGEPFSFTLNGGDVYVMSEKAVGHDWNKPSQFTLRHAAGAKNYRSLKRFQKT